MGEQLAWLTYLTTHPGFAQFWRPKDLEVEESIELLHVNQQICALLLWHRLGLFRGRRLCCGADVVVKSECGRAYGERFGSFCEAEAGGVRLAGGFTGTMYDACARAAENSNVPKGAVLVGE
ncbi:spore coat protein [Streptomyces tendae]|uniref:spore coat protein n=1 Tax=Streptomyces tendae TaxID=1932 RepID=UPI0036962F5D